MHQLSTEKMLNSLTALPPFFSVLLLGLGPRCRSILSSLKRLLTVYKGQENRDIIEQPRQDLTHRK